MYIHIHPNISYISIRPTSASPITSRVTFKKEKATCRRKAGVLVPSASGLDTLDLKLQFAAFADTNMLLTTGPVGGGHDVATSQLRPMFTCTSLLLARQLLQVAEALQDESSSTIL